jgi:hypothetical protein
MQERQAQERASPSRQWLRTSLRNLTVMLPEILAVELFSAWALFASTAFLNPESLAGFRLISLAATTLALSVSSSMSIGLLLAKDCGLWPSR